MTLCRGESLLKFTTSVLCKQRCYNSYLRLGWERACEHWSEPPDEKKTKKKTVCWNHFWIKFGCREKLACSIVAPGTRVSEKVRLIFFLDHQHSECNSTVAVLYPLPDSLESDFFFIFLVIKHLHGCKLAVEFLTVGNSSLAKSFWPTQATSVHRVAWFWQEVKEQAVISGRG